MDNKADLSLGIVATAPSPATSGTSITLQAGQGADMPPVPFKALLYPPGVIPTRANAERVRVTARPGSSDTFTILRAQGIFTAKTVATGWVMSNNIFADDINNSSVTFDEALTGTINGVNTVFTTTANFTTIQVYKNGVRMTKAGDFSITGANQITFVTAPVANTVLTADYVTGSQVSISGTSSVVNKETPTGAVNGTNAVFTTANPYVGGSLQVYVNGLAQGTFVTETTPSTGTFTLDVAPTAGDNIFVSYQFASSVYGNADTVDSIHASSTATANTLLPLNSSAAYPSTVLGLMSNAQVITFNSTGNFTTGNNALGSPVNVTFPAGVTKAIILGQIRVQAQSGTQTDARIWLGMDGTTTCLRQDVIFTQPNSSGTFTSATCAMISDVTGISAGTHTFQVYGSATSSFNAGVCTIMIIPVGG